MPRVLAAAALLLLASTSFPADSKYSVKVGDSAPPKELAEPIRALLSAKGMTVADEKGKVLGMFWPVKSLESKAKPSDAGLKYTQIDETTVVGAVKFAEPWTDYRKQKVKAGAYTLRLAVQPMDGDHMGTAPYNEFVLLCPAAEDRKPDLLEVTAMHELSAKSIGRKHPAMMLLFPNKTPPEAPAIQAKPNNHFLLSYRVPVSAGGEKSQLGFSLVIVGVTMAE
jgi:hypothetical protein